jgi:hypothetical protein
MKKVTWAPSLPPSLSARGSSSPPSSQFSPFRIGPAQLHSLAHLARTRALSLSLTRNINVYLGVMYIFVVYIHFDMHGCCRFAQPPMLKSYLRL